MVNIVSTESYRDQRGRRFHRRLVKITSFGAGHNTPPHGLPVAPYRVQIEPITAGLWNEYQAADATYLYINAPADNATCKVLLEWRC